MFGTCTISRRGGDFVCVCVVGGRRGVETDGRIHEVYLIRCGVWNGESERERGKDKEREKDVSRFLCSPKCVCLCFFLKVLLP